MDQYLSDENDLQINEISNKNNNKDNKILDDDNIKNFLTTISDSDIPLHKNYDVDKNWRRINDYEFLPSIVNQVPTTNYEIAYIVDEETQYGGTLGKLIYLGMFL